MSTRSCLLAGLFALSAALPAAAVEIGPGAVWTVVTDGGGVRGVESAVREAGRAVADSLAESVGAKVAVVLAADAPAGPGGRLFVGRVFAERAGLLAPDFDGWDWGIAEKGGDVYFFGRDRAGAHPQWATGCRAPSALAAIRFLCDEVGVRFVMPGKVGREVPRRARIEVPDGFFRRGSVAAEFQNGRCYDLPYNYANGIYGSGVLHSYGGHTYPVACPRATYRETHPEYFARNAKGEVIWSQTDGCQAYCISNPDFRRLVYEELLRRFDAGADVCQLAQNDGAAGLCRCRACHDLYGTGDDWCEKIWLFHRGLAEDILRDRPGKVVQIICYADTARPPKTFTSFPSNVMVEICGGGEATLERWRGYVVPQGFTYYIYNWSWYPLPGFTPKCALSFLEEQVARFRRLGLRGVYRCGFGEMFGMEGPAYWVFNRMLQDPSADVAREVEAYLAAAFGPAAAPMRRFYADLEEPLQRVEKMKSIKATDLVEGTISRTPARDPIVALATVYTPARVARMDAALKEAQQTAGLSARQTRRLQLVRTEWNYVRNVGTIAERYDRFRKLPTKALCDEILDALDVRNAMLDRLFPDGKMRRLPDWPELQLFGNPPREQMRVNGRLGAIIRTPLEWDVARMRAYRIVPNEVMTPEERRAELAAAGLKPLAGFRSPDTGKPGAFFRPTPDGTGFTFGQGTNHHVRVLTRVGPAQGLHAGKTYRVSYLTRWRDVTVERWWHGYLFSADFAPWRKDAVTRVKVPSETPHIGTTDAWRRESAVFTVTGPEGFVSDFCFYFWGGRNGVAEVRDVALEEVAPDRAPGTGDTNSNTNNNTNSNTKGKTEK